MSEVKALEWKLNEEGHQVADVFFGVYYVERNPIDRWCWGMRFIGEQGIGLYTADNFEAAKAAAQSDYGTRIRSALAAAPSTASEPAQKVVSVHPQVLQELECAFAARLKDTKNTRSEPRTRDALEVIRAALASQEKTDV